MKIHGIFVGIDRFGSPAISWLSCAKRDAVALHALFSDNLPGEYELLFDESATRQNIEKNVTKLASCSENDVVIFSFSGHGTTTHQLVCYDTNVSEISTTTIPLDLLAEWFTKIPARQLICIIDCCFSGGIGAKALEVQISPRDFSSAKAKIEQFSGKGRVILTASKATEPAWENNKLGHGLLTHHLLEALLGAEEARKDGKIGMFRLLEYVCSSVKSSADSFGEMQNPMLLGQITEEISFPIFEAGALYRAAFPERDSTFIKSDIQTLVNVGFPQGIVDSWKEDIPSLNELQVSAINEFGILRGQHLVVSAPTSSGKTMIGELAAIHGIVQRKRAIFLFPLKALVNDKQRHFTHTYGRFDIKTIKVTGESSSDDLIPLMRGRYDICLMTYEKFTSIIMSHPYILNQIGAVIVDEAQMVADKNRGINLEFILTLLKLKRREGVEPQLIALSAVIGNLNGFDRWLGGRLLFRKDRPIPLNEGVIKANGVFRYIESDSGEEKSEHVVTTTYRKGSGQDVIIPLVQKLIDEGKNVIVFRETKSEAQFCALYLANNLNLPSATKALNSLSLKDPSKTTEYLRQVLSKGVGFHISDLDAEERVIVEENFRDKTSGLKVIAATTTLAMGVNTPAEAVIVAGLDHPGNVPYTVAEYKNIIGRAGRLGYAERGYSFLVTITAVEEFTLWDKYVNGVPEDLSSHFLSSNTDIRSLILRVLAASRSNKGLNEQQIIAFLEESFGAYQERFKYDSWSWNVGVIQVAIAELRSHKLIKMDDEGFYHTTVLGKLAGDSGLEVQSIVRIVDVLQQLSIETISDPALIAIAQLCLEMEQVYMPINKKSIHKEPQTWSSAMRQQPIPHQIMQAFNRYSAVLLEETTKSKKTIACLLWITEMELIGIESILMQHNRSDAAAGALRAVVSRTCDILPIIARIAEILHGCELSERMDNLLTRLELGVPSQIRELSQMLGRELSRGEYLALLKSGIINKDDFRSANVDLLLTLFTKEKIERVLSRLDECEEKHYQRNPVLPPIPLYQP